MIPLSHAIADLDLALGFTPAEPSPALVPILSAIGNHGHEQALKIAKHTYAALAEAGMDSEVLVIGRASPMSILAITISLLEEAAGRPHAARRWALTAAANLEADEGNTETMRAVLAARRAVSEALHRYGT